MTKTRASACYGRVSPLTEFLIMHGSGTSGLLPSASGPASLRCLPECVSVKFRLGAGSLKSLLKSLAPSDIKQTHNSLRTLHFPCVSLIHYVSLSLHLPFNSQSCRSLPLSLCQPPLPHSPVRLSVMLSPFMSGCHHNFPTRTLFPPSHPSPCLYISPPLLFSTGLIPL